LKSGGVDIVLEESVSDEMAKQAGCTSGKRKGKAVIQG
jgi:hypothetical protein